MEIKNKWIIRDSFYPTLLGKYCVLNSFFASYKPTEVRSIDLQSISIFYTGEYSIAPHSRITFTWDILELDEILSNLNVKATYVIANLTNTTTYTTVHSDDLVVDETHVMSGLLYPEDIKVFGSDEFSKLTHSNTVLHINSNALSSRDPRIESGSLKIIDSDDSNDVSKGHIRAFSVRVENSLDYMKISEVKNYLVDIIPKVHTIINDSSVDWEFYVCNSYAPDGPCSTLHKLTKGSSGFNSNIKCIDKSLNYFHDMVEDYKSSLSFIDKYSEFMEFGVYITIKDHQVDAYNRIITKLMLCDAFIVAILYADKLPNDTDLIHIMK